MDRMMMRRYLLSGTRVSERLGRILLSYVRIVFVKYPGVGAVCGAAGMTRRVVKLLNLDRPECIIIP